MIYGRLRTCSSDHQGGIDLETVCPEGRILKEFLF